MFPHFGGSPAVGALDEMGACDTAASGLEIDAQSTRHFANRRQPPPGPSPHSGPDFVPRRSLFRNASGWRTPISRKHLAKVMRKRKRASEHRRDLRCQQDEFRSSKRGLVGSQTSFGVAQSPRNRSRTPSIGVKALNFRQKRRFSPFLRPQTPKNGRLATVQTETITPKRVLLPMHPGKLLRYSICCLSLRTISVPGTTPAPITRMSLRAS